MVLQVTGIRKWPVMPVMASVFFVVPVSPLYPNISPWSPEEL